MTKLLTVFIALLGSVALARFTPPSQVSVSAEAPAAQFFKAGSDAAVQLTFQGSSSGFGSFGGFGSDDENSYSEECSGTAISNDGYVLTALHCLATCASALTKHDIDGGEYYTTDTAKVQRGSASCRVTARFNNRYSYSGRAKLIAVGRGFFENKDAGITPAVQAAFAAGIGPANDYAILKLDRNPALGCVRANTRVDVGEKVWNMAYPSATDRGDGFDAPGDQVMFSSGVITSLSNPLHSTIDIVPSSSGSGLFDYGGQLVALSNSLSGSGGTNLKTEMPGTARSTSIQHIQDDAGAIYGSTVVNQAFSCY